MANSRRPISLVAALVFLPALIVADPAQERPTFRAGVDLIQLDVSVLDRDRRPLRGLSDGDFTILEDGRPQRISAFAAVDIPDAEPAPIAPAPWIREVAPDVRQNTRPEGRLFAIVMDDGLMPFDPWMINHAKAIARGVVDRLRPGDLASVIFTASNQHAQDFTNDRPRLYKAIETFRGGWAGCGGLRETLSPHLDAPMNVLFHLMEPLGRAPQRLKSVFFIGVSLPNTRTGSREIGYIKEELYRRARRANVSVYPIDPSGSGMEHFQLLKEQMGGCGLGASPGRVAKDWHALMLSILETSSENRHTVQELAANTGGRAVLDHNNAVLELDEIFEENASYYVLGYETAKTGDRLRRIEVKVNRPGVTVRSRSGWRPSKALPPDAPPRLRAEQALGQVIPTAEVPMRLALAPFATPGRSEGTLIMAIGVRERSPQSRTEEKVSVAIAAFTGEGFHRQTVRQEASITLRPAVGGAAELDLLAQLKLKPGRYSIRVGAHSGFSRNAGSVFADVEVPDFARAPLSLSGIVVSASPGPFAAPRDEFSKLLPVVPTTRREFARTDAVTVFLRIYQALRAVAGPVDLSISIRDDQDRHLLDHRDTLAAERFDGHRAADHQFALPIGALVPGEYLLTVEATKGETSERRDVRFGVR